MLLTEKEQEEIKNALLAIVKAGDLNVSIFLLFDKFSLFKIDMFRHFAHTSSIGSMSRFKERRKKCQDSHQKRKR